MYPDEADRRPHRTHLRRSGALAAAIATITLLTSCVPNPSPAPPPAQSPTPSPSPTVEEPRYAPIDVGFCDRAKLYELAREVGLARETKYSRTVPTVDPEPSEEGVLNTAAVCQFRAGAYRPDKLYAWFSASVTLEVYSSTEVAVANEWYYDVVLYRTPNPGWSSVLAEIDGWWDEGVSIEYDDIGESFSGRDTGFGLDIYLRHANLFLVLWTSGQAPEPDAPEAREILSELAWLVINEAMGHVSEI